MCFLGLSDGILILVFARCRVGAGSSAVDQRGSGDDTVGHLHFRHLHLLLSDLCVESEVEFALGHFRHVVEAVLHCVVAANLVRNLSVVGLNFLTLECGRLTLCTAFSIAQYGGYSHNGFFLHVFFRKASVDGHRHFTAHSLHRRRGHCEIVGREFAELVT